MKYEKDKEKVARITVSMPSMVLFKGINHAKQLGFTRKMGIESDFSKYNSFVLSSAQSDMRIKKILEEKKRELEVKV